MDVLQALRSLEGKGAFDMHLYGSRLIIRNWSVRCWNIFKDSSSCWMQNTLIIVEADLDTDFGYVEALGYQQLRSKEYKTNKHVFLIKTQAE